MALPKRPASRKKIYMDHAAATPLDRRVFRDMEPFFTTDFANPSALYGIAVKARTALENSRKIVAHALGTQPDTILFTGSGTESVNAAIFGVCSGRQQGHIITTTIEHKAVLEPIRQLEKEGWVVTYLPVDRAGQISLADFKKALRKNTVLVSIMYANNEIGTILPIADIGRDILKWRKVEKSRYPYFHTDACQAAGYLDLFVDRLHVDLLSANGSKIYGPKGVGFLFKRRGADIAPLIVGGGQEFGFRSGTENVPGIVGFAKALQLVNHEAGSMSQELTKLRDYFWKEIKKKIPDAILNSPEENRLPNNLNVSFNGVDAEALILYLDAYNIICSSGSACTTDSDDVSHVLTACGVSPEQARSSIRFTLGKETTKKEITHVMRYLPIIVKELRVWNKS